MARDPAQPTAWSRIDTAWIAAIGLVGLGLRLVCVLEFTAHPIGKMPWVDEGAYWTRAQEIVQGRWLPDRPFYQDPLFPYALAVFMKLVGAGIAALRTALACVGALTPVAIYWAGRRGLGRAEAIVAAGAIALYGPLVFTDGLIEKEGLAALLAALALGCAAALTAARPGLAPAWAGVSGWTWGMVALLRANALVVGPLGTIWTAWISRAGRGRAFGLRSASSFFVGFALALAPALAVNYAVGRPRELLPTTCQTGANFYIGNGPGATGTYRAPDFVEANPAREADDFAAEAERRTGRRLTPGQVSRYWGREGLKPWRDAPRASLRLLAKKVGLLLHDFEIPDNQDFTFIRIVAAPHLAWGVLSFGWLTPWAALGLARRDRSPFWWFLAISTFAGLASTAVFFVVGRYRIPWTPGLALLAGAGAVDIARLARGRRVGAVAWRLVLLALPAAVLAWRPLADPVPDRWGHAELALAVAELGHGSLEAALDAFDDARAVSPGAALQVAALTTAGPVHDRLAVRLGVAIDLDRRVGSPTGVRHARRLRQLPGGRAESRQLLETALAEVPDNREARREWAAWWLGASEDPRARSRAAVELTRAVQGPAGDPSARVLLALLSRDRTQLPDPADGLRANRLRLAREILARSAALPP